MMAACDTTTHLDGHAGPEIVHFGEAFSVHSGHASPPPSGGSHPGLSAEGNGPNPDTPSGAENAHSLTTDATLGMEGNGWSSESTPAAARAKPLAMRAEMAIDSRPPGSSPRTQAVRFGPPPRVAERPRVQDWMDDELLTLPEAVALFWPHGPLTVTSLRTAGHEGSLEITVVAGKHFVTPAAIRSMGKREVSKAKGEAVSPDIDPAADLLRRIAETRSAGHQQRRRASR